MRFQPSQYSYGESTLAPKTEDENNNGGLLFGLGAASLLAAALIPTFVVYPLVIKAFKPELSYWRRVGIGTGITMAAGLVTGIVKAGAKTK